MRGFYWNFYVELHDALPFWANYGALLRWLCVRTGWKKIQCMKGTQASYLMATNHNCLETILIFHQNLFTDLSSVFYSSNESSGKQLYQQWCASLISEEQLFYTKRHSTPYLIEQLVMDANFQAAHPDEVCRRQKVVLDEIVHKVQWPRDALVKESHAYD